MLICKWSFLVGFWMMLGCAGHLRPSAGGQSSAGQSYWAKQSFYGGLFFDDDRYGFLSPIEFEKLRCLKSPSGDYIVPAPSDHVISVGTRVNIQKIEWPTDQNRIKRPLLTPGHLPWIYLTVALDRGSVTINRPRTYIMLVPEEIRSNDALAKWFSRYFSQEDNNLWFLNLSLSEREAILKPPK